MIVKPGPALYRLNLIRDLREREVKSERQHRLAVILALGCFGFFFMSLLYSGLTIWQMERVLDHEGEKVETLRQEYQKYAAARLIVDKDDIELLNNLQGKGIFWTKKLAAMAKHLPESYSITQFAYGNDELRVAGFGFVNPKQDQLLVLDDYLNRLRSDSSFSDTFTRLQLNTAERTNDANGQVTFGFSAFTANWKAQ